MLGDRIDYNNTNTVNWLGGYVQGEYTKDKFTVFAIVGYSSVRYDYTDHFKKDEITGKELNLVVDWTSGYQIKGGASFRTSETVHLYVNGGYVSKVPLFDQVISDVNGTFIENPTNEKFLSFEAGANTTFLQNKLNLSANVYYTDWSDRIDNIPVTNADGTDGLVRLFNVSSRHMGVELDGYWQAARWLRFDGAISIGNWEYTEDAPGLYIANFGTDSTLDINTTIKDLKVGDAPQSQIYLGLSIFPVPGMHAQILWRYYDNYYSQFDPFDRADSVVVDREQTWEIPAYGLFEFHFRYAIPAQVLGLDVTVFAHVFNLANALYVQDAVDNSQFNAWRGDADPNDPDDDGKNHESNDAEIYPGLPTAFNIGFSLGL